MIIQKNVCHFLYKIYITQLSVNVHQMSVLRYFTHVRLNIL